MTPGGLELAWPTGERRLWSWDQIRQTRGGSLGDAAQFERGDPPLASLLVRDPRIVAAMRALGGAEARKFRPPRSGRRVSVIGLAILATLVAGAIALYLWGIPALASMAADRVPFAWEERVGREIVLQLAPPERRIEDPAVTEALARILARLESGLDPGDRVPAMGVDRARGLAAPYQFRLFVADDAQVNAFATPGGNIVVLRGLLGATRTPEELAAVLAHEMQHVVRRHSVKALLQHASLGLLVGLVAGDPGPASAGLELTRHLGELSYSRSTEIEADEEALRQLRRARIDPGGALTFLERLGSADPSRLPAFLSTHPGAEERVARLRGMIAAQAPVEAEPLLAPAEWEALVQRARSVQAESGR